MNKLFYPGKPYADFVKSKIPALLFLFTLANAAPVHTVSRHLDPRPIFTWPTDTTVTNRPKTTFSADVDLSKTKAFNQGEPMILLTIITPDGGTYLLDSRPLHAGEKVHWQGKVPAKGGYVLRVISPSGSSASRGGPMFGPIYFRLISDAQGNFHSQ